MPNWKKVIVSGSDAALNSLDVSTSITGSSFTGSFLRLSENGTGFRMTNVGAFDNSSGDFRIFATQDLILATDGENGTAVTIDQTTKDANFVGAITGSALQLGNLGAANEILIVGANTEVTSSNLLAIDTVNQRVGIGTSTPEVKLDLVGESSGEAQVRVAQHDNTSDGPDIRFFKSHNTAASPSAVANNDYIGAVNAFAYDGSDYIQSGFFGFQADGTDGDSKFGLRTRVGGTLTDRITIDAAGDVSIGGSLEASGDIVAFASSDKRLKDNISYITDPISKIQKIGGYEFDWNEKQSTYEGHDVGVIAQEIEKVLPEVVTTRKNGYKAVKYEKIVALLIEGMKEQQLQIDDLKAQLNGKK